MIVGAKGQIFNLDSLTLRIHPINHDFLCSRVSKRAKQNALPLDSRNVTGFVRTASPCTMAFRTGPIGSTPHKP